MDFDRLINWTVKRSGAGMTIEGTDECGRPRKIFVISIASGRDGRPPRTIGPDGTEYELV